MKVRTKRVAGLLNTFSGVAGEAKVAAELLRCGFQVAKPFWTHDEVDLIVQHPVGSMIFPIPIQVKSVQFLDSKTRKHWQTRYVEKLKKKYVEENPALCLAIYRPDSDRIWFIDGPENIKAIHDKHAKKPYSMLGEKSNVRIRLTFENCPLDKDWLAPNGDCKWWSDRLSRLASRLEAANLLTVQVHRYTEQMFEDEEIDDYLKDETAPSSEPDKETPAS